MAAEFVETITLTRESYDKLCEDLARSSARAQLWSDRVTDAVQAKLGNNPHPYDDRGAWREFYDRENALRKTARVVVGEE